MNFKEKSKEEYLLAVDTFFKNKCKNCKVCKNDNDECFIRMLLDGTINIYGVPTCIASNKEFREVMTKWQ